MCECVCARVRVRVRVCMFVCVYVSCVHVWCRRALLLVFVCVWVGGRGGGDW